MVCRNCGHRFAANYLVDGAPGGQEAPGTFLILGVFLLVLGAGLLGASIAWETLWVGALGLGLVVGALFAWSQVLVAWADCWDVPCPKCKAKLRVRPWSR
jgi:hypothetical protein